MTDQNTTLLDDGLMLDAASGAAPEAVRVLAACQAELRPDAHDRLRTAEAVFGALLERSAGAVVSAGLFDTTLQQLDDRTATINAGVRDTRLALPRALQDALAVNSRTDWRPRFGGVDEIVIEALCEDGVHARLLRIPKGGSAVEHSHDGAEYTLVLSGAFTDETGHYGPGDACTVEPGSVHRPVVDGDEACICFAVELGELRPTHPVLGAARWLFGRLL